MTAAQHSIGLPGSQKVTLS